MHATLCLRILLGAVLGGVIGYERDVHGHPAGLRTHIMVALASATFMVVSTHFALVQGDGAGADGSRIAASVVSGIGFLAGGAIFRTGLSVKGLTTAGGLWLVSAVGLSAGAGMFVESAMATLLGLAVLTVLRRFERKPHLTVLHRLQVAMRAPMAPLATLVERLRAEGAKVLNTDLERDLPAHSTHVRLSLQLPEGASGERLLDALETLEGVVTLRLERLE